MTKVLHHRRLTSRRVNITDVNTIRDLHYAGSTSRRAYEK